MCLSSHFKKIGLSKQNFQILKVNSFLNLFTHWFSEIQHHYTLDYTNCSFEFLIQYKNKQKYFQNFNLSQKIKKVQSLKYQKQVIASSEKQRSNRLEEYNFLNQPRIASQQTKHFKIQVKSQICKLLSYWLAQIM